MSVGKIQMQDGLVSTHPKCLLVTSTLAYHTKASLTEIFFNNIWQQGINGILADEMGLGKTVQSLAMLAHIAEKYSMLQFIVCYGMVVC
jgi:hypothetical protein